MKTKDTKAVGR